MSKALKKVPCNKAGYSKRKTIILILSAYILCISLFQPVYAKAEENRGLSQDMQARERLHVLADQQDRQAGRLFPAFSQDKESLHAPVSNDVPGLISFNGVDGPGTMYNMEDMDDIDSIFTNRGNPGPLIRADSAILIDCERGQVLYSKQADKRLHISTANKIMTAVIVIEKGNLEAKVTVSKEATQSEGSVLPLEAGEKYTLEDLLNALILTNTNDVANTLAEHIGGDIQQFVEIMNKKAEELNMKNTYFTNPTGLYDENQYTTANDIAVLLRYVLSLPVFNRIFSYRAVPWVDRRGTTLLTNSNRLFWEYEGVDGGKAGYNDIQLQTAITTATRGNRRLAAIVLDSPESSVLQDSIKLLDHGFNNFRRDILVPRNQPLTSMVVGNEEINLISTNDIYYTYPIGNTYIKSINFNLSKDVKPPLTKNMIVGMARYTLQDGTIIDVSLYPEKEIIPPESFYSTLLKRLKENRDIYVLLISLVCVEVLVILFKLLKGIARFARHLKNRRNSLPSKKSS
ncbi:MAG: D-alanyl-D-alanine carboxypeptidase [Clostridiaceae bacterium]|nr:D-alanyl-D-alanine carboxypeptidase [Clostridiaceae bacterium]